MQMLPCIVPVPHQRIPAKGLCEPSAFFVLASLVVTLAISVNVQAGTTQGGASSRAVAISSPAAVIDFGVRPVAPQALAPNVVLTGAAITLSVSATGTAPIAFLWSFGDGTQSLPGFTLVGPNGTTDTVLHNYNLAGTYTASVTATDPSGNVAASSVIVLVDTPPQIGSGPTVSPNPSFMDVTDTFTVVAFDVDNNLLTYIWNFGEPAGVTNIDPDTQGVTVQSDNSVTGDNSNVIHAYLSQFARLYTFGADGTATVTGMLTIDDNHGGTVTAPFTVTLISPTNPQSPYPLTMVIQPHTGVALQTNGGWAGTYSFAVGQAFDPLAVLAATPPPNTTPAGSPDLLNAQPLPVLNGPTLPALNVTISITGTGGAVTGITQAVVGTVPSFFARFTAPGVYVVTATDASDVPVMRKTITVTTDQLQVAPLTSEQSIAQANIFFNGLIQGQLFFVRQQGTMKFTSIFALPQPLTGATHQLNIGVGNILANATLTKLTGVGTEKLTVLNPGVSGSLRYRVTKKQQVRVQVQLKGNLSAAGLDTEGADVDFVNRGEDFVFDPILGDFRIEFPQLIIQTAVLFDSNFKSNGQVFALTPNQQVTATWKVRNNVGTFRNPQIAPKEQQ